MNNAYLYVDGLKLPVKYLDYNFRQFKGTNNKPKGKVHGGEFSFTLDIDNKEAITLIEWMLSSTAQKNGYIEIKDFTLSSIAFKLEFANAYATAQDFRYEAYSNLPLQTNVTVTAGALRFNREVTFLQTWNPDDPFSNNATTVSYIEENEEEISEPDDTKTDQKCSRLYFVAGAGNDLVGWNYSTRFKEIWTNLGISGFKKIDVPSGSDYMAKHVLPINDILYVTQNRNDVANRASNEGLASTELQKPAHRRARIKIEKDLKSNPCSENEQLNLCGYSYGSVVVAQTALQLCDDGFTIDNLILIGSPIPTKSELYDTLQKYKSDGKICQIIRHDIKNDKFSNPKDFSEFLEGAADSGNENPHFDLARPDNPETPEVNEEKIANLEIKKLGQILIQKGIK